MSGAKILEGLREAVAGNFASVLIEGQHWYRADTVADMVAAERERCAKLVEAVMLERKPTGQRVALAIAAKAVRRGRLLTEVEV
jgi:hypothetical protein